MNRVGDRYGLGWVRSGRVGSDRVDSGRIGSGPDRVESGRIRSDQVESGRIKLNLVGIDAGLGVLGSS